MTRLPIFDSPLLLGFDHFERTFDRLKKTGSDGYPPYNIEQTSDHDLRITLAVAGFTMDNLDVEVEQNQLIIRGQQQEDEEEDRIFLHRGIAKRAFSRGFTLSDDMVVKGADLVNGMLTISLERIVPEVQKPKVIEICSHFVQ